MGVLFQNRESQNDANLQRDYDILNKKYLVKRRDDDERDNDKEDNSRSRNDERSRDDSRSDNDSRNNNNNSNNNYSNSNNNNNSYNNNNNSSNNNNNNSHNNDNSYNNNSYNNNNNNSNNNSNNSNGNKSQYHYSGVSSEGAYGNNGEPISIDGTTEPKLPVLEEDEGLTPKDVYGSMYFQIGAGTLAAVIVAFLIIRFLLKHRKKADLSKNFNANYTKSKDIIKHPDAEESFSYDSRDDNLSRIESTDSIIKMFHSADITYEKNSLNMNNSMLSLSSLTNKNVTSLTSAHLMKSPQGSEYSLTTSRSLQNMTIPSSSSSFSSQDSKTLQNSKTFGSLKPQRRSKFISSRSRSLTSSNYYMSSDFVMTPLVTKKIPGLDKTMPPPTDCDFVDYPPTPLPESLDDIPYSDNPDIDSDTDGNIIPPEVDVSMQALPNRKNSQSFVKNHSNVISRQASLSPKPSPRSSRIKSTPPRERSYLQNQSHSKETPEKSQTSQIPIPGRVQPQLFTTESSHSKFISQQMPQQDIRHKSVPISPSFNAHQLQSVSENDLSNQPMPQSNNHISKRPLSQSVQQIPQHQPKSPKRLSSLPQPQPDTSANHISNHPITPQRQPEPPVPNNRNSSKPSQHIPIQPAPHSIQQLSQPLHPTQQLSQQTYRPLSFKAMMQSSSQSSIHSNLNMPKQPSQSSQPSSGQQDAMTKIQQPVSTQKPLSPRMNSFPKSQPVFPPKELPPKPQPRVSSKLVEAQQQALLQQAFQQHAQHIQPQHIQPQHIQPQHPQQQHTQQQHPQSQHSQQQRLAKPPSLKNLVSTKENRELTFEEEMMASFDKFNNTNFENELDNVNTPRIDYSKQVI